MKYLNLGCGSRLHRDWTNVDLQASSPHVLRHDLRHRLPFPSAAFDVVYHSHVLEHLAKNEAPRFIDECSRVLKRGGVLRVVVPDLMTIAKQYLAALVRAETKAPNGEADHEWMMLEMYDQTVRDCPGGEMLRFLRRMPVPNEAFILDRCGMEVQKIIESTGNENEKTEKQVSRLSQMQKLLGRFFWVDQGLKAVREALLRVLLGTEYHALQIGRFRLSGEIHQWMYDRFSVSRIILESGFTEIVRRNAFTSYVPQWATFNLDTEPDGTVYKPDSLYMEGRKP
jgi:hypothetical protein